MAGWSATFFQRRRSTCIGRCVLHFLFLLPTAYCLLPTAFAGQLPSLFRGVVVADGSPGVRVVSVEERSQASLADLRPEDIIVQINDAPINRIDDFAVISHTLKGSSVKANVVVLRNGQPQELLVHLYSYPILRHWDLAFVPEPDFHFADLKAGVAYWTRLGRGFEMVGNEEQALNAYLNALHNDPTQLELALKASELLWRLAQARLKARRLPDALMAIQQGTVLLNRLFDQSLDDSQLESVKSQLQRTLYALHQAAS